VVTTNQEGLYQVEAIARQGVILPPAVVIVLPELIIHQAVVTDHPVVIIHQAVVITTMEAMGITEAGIHTTGGGIHTTEDMAGGMVHRSFLDHGFFRPGIFPIHHPSPTHRLPLFMLCLIRSIHMHILIRHL
jgi:hypothetical protein